MTAQDLERKGFVLVGDSWQKLKKAKNEIDHQPSGAKPQCTVRNVAVGTSSRKEANAGIRKVCVVSYRTRLIDPDNLCPKYFIDALRYCGVITGDSAKHITLEVRQEKSDNPRTEIEIT